MKLQIKEDSVVGIYEELTEGELRDIAINRELNHIKKELSLYMPKSSAAKITWHMYRMLLIK